MNRLGQNSRWRICRCKTGREGRRSVHNRWMEMLNHPQEQVRLPHSPACSARAAPLLLAHLQGTAPPPEALHWTHARAGLPEKAGMGAEDATLLQAGLSGTHCQWTLLNLPSSTRFQNQARFVSLGSSHSRERFLPLGWPVCLGPQGWPQHGNFRVELRAILGKPAPLVVTLHFAHCSLLFLFLVSQWENPDRPVWFTLMTESNPCRAFVSSGRLQRTQR